MTVDKRPKFFINELNLVSAAAFVIIWLTEVKNQPLASNIYTHFSLVSNIILGYWGDGNTQASITSHVLTRRSIKSL